MAIYDYYSGNYMDAYDPVDSYAPGLDDDYGGFNFDDIFPEIDIPDPSPALPSLPDDPFAGQSLGRAGDKFTGGLSPEEEEYFDYFNNPTEAPSYQEALARIQAMAMIPQGRVQPSGGGGGSYSYTKEVKPDVIADPRPPLESTIAVKASQGAGLSDDTNKRGIVRSMLNTMSTRGLASITDSNKDTLDILSPTFNPTPEQVAGAQKIGDSAAQQSLKRYGLDSKSLAEAGIEQSYTAKEAQTIVNAIQEGVSPEAYRSYIQSKSSGFPSNQNQGSVFSFTTLGDGPEEAYRLSESEKAAGREAVNFLRSQGASEEQMENLRNQLRARPESEALKTLASAVSSVEEDPDNINLIGKQISGLDADPSSSDPATNLDLYREVFPTRTPDQQRQFNNFGQKLAMMSQFGRETTGREDLTGVLKRRPSEEELKAAVESGNQQKARELASQYRQATHDEFGNPLPVSFSETYDKNARGLNMPSREKVGQQQFAAQFGRLPTGAEQGQIRLARFLSETPQGQTIKNAINQGSYDLLNATQNIFNSVRSNSDREFREAVRSMRNVFEADLARKQSSKIGMQLSSEQEKIANSLRGIDVNQAARRLVSGEGTARDQEIVMQGIAMQSMNNVLQDPQRAVRNVLDSNSKLLQAQIRSASKDTDINVLRTSGVYTSAGFNTDMLAKFQQNATDKNLSEEERTKAQTIVKAYNSVRESGSEYIEKMNLLVNARYQDVLSMIITNGGMIDYAFLKAQQNEGDSENASSSANNGLPTPVSVPEAQPQPTLMGVGLMGSGEEENKDNENVTLSNRRPTSQYGLTNQIGYGGIGISPFR